MLASRYQLLFSSNTANMACCSLSAFSWTSKAWFTPRRRDDERTHARTLLTCTFLTLRDSLLQMSIGPTRPEATSRGASTALWYMRV